MYTITLTANGHQVTKTLIMYKPIKTVQNRILQKKKKKNYIVGLFKVIKNKFVFYKMRTSTNSHFIKYERV